MNFAKRTRRAFTLVELLTVIAILVLLLSLLMPTLRKSKELARRTLCATHCRALQVILTMYSVNNGGCIPLGYQGNAEFRQTNYLVNQAYQTIGSRPNMHYGCLYNDKLLGDAKSGEPRKYYCPSSTIPLFQFDTDINPWLRIGRPGDYLNWTRLGYGTRPLGAWDATTGWLCYGWPLRSRKDVPRADQMDSGMAIVSDIVSTPDYVSTHHGDGVNFTRLSGATQWFDRAAFNEKWQKLPLYDYTPGQDMPAFYDETSNPPRGVWFDMDR